MQNPTPAVENLGMSRKKAKKEPKARENPEPKATRPKGKSRALVVLSVVETDSTFSPITGRPGGRGPEDPFLPRKHLGWQGNCIHCNTKLFVTESGATDATLEHIQPLCDDGDATNPHNLALACKRCNNEKGVRHDQHAGKGGRADEVIAKLREKRMSRWREPVQTQAPQW